MNLRALEAFCAVYEEGSFTAGARRLGLAQPTVSSHVRSLEREFDVRLFDRSSRETRPTEAARLLHRHTRRILDQARRMTEELDQLGHGLRGSLSVGASTIPGEYWLPQVIRQFHEARPEITVSVEIRDSRVVIERVIEGEIEMGIVGSRMEDRRLEYRELIEDSLVLVAPTVPKRAGSAEVTPAELARIPFVLRESGSGTRHRFEKALHALGISPEDLHMVAELGSTTAVKEAVRSGLGWTVLSRLAVRAELAAGSLLEIEVSQMEVLKRSILAALPRDRPLSLLGRTFLDFLLESEA